MTLSAGLGGNKERPTVRGLGWVILGGSWEPQVDCLITFDAEENNLVIWVLLGLGC
jgi:hypothetical protein